MTISATSCDCRTCIEKFDTLIIVHLLSICLHGQRSCLSNLPDLQILTTCKIAMFSFVLVFYWLSHWPLLEKKTISPSRSNLRTVNKDSVCDISERIEGIKNGWWNMHWDAVTTPRPEGFMGGCLLELCNVSDRDHVLSYETCSLCQTMA